MTRKQVSLSYLIVVVALLTGCTVGKKYQRPQIASPPEFRSAPAGAANNASLADEKWFELFKDPQLQQLIRTALVNNYDLREAVARVEASRAQLGITRADQLPTVTGGAAVTTERFAAGGSFPIPPGVKQTRTFGQVGLNL